MSKIRKLFKQDKNDNFIKWFTGFFDGEGDVSFLFNKNSKKWRTFLQVRVTNCDLKILQYIESKVGGRIYIKKDSLYRKNVSVSYVWTLPETSEDMLLFLKKVQKYSRCLIKRKRLALIVNGYGRIRKFIENNRGQPLPPSEIKYRQNLSNRVQSIRCRSLKDY